MMLRELYIYLKRNYYCGKFNRCMLSLELDMPKELVTKRLSKLKKQGVIYLLDKEPHNYKLNPEWL